MQDNQSIIGHTRIKKLLGQFLARDIAHHLYLLHGPQHIGKKALGRALAESIVHGKKDIEWSKKFPIHVDVLELMPESKTSKAGRISKTISVESIRTFRKMLSRTPHGMARVVIIDDAQTMTIPAQNALLKELEEPRGATYFIIITSDIDTILPTIISRGMVLECGVVSHEDLQRHGYSDEQIAYAGGAPGKIHHDIESNNDEKYDHAIATLKNLHSMSLSERLRIAQEINEDIAHTLRTLDIWIARVRHSAHTHKRYDVLPLAKKMMVARDQLERSNANPRLTLEHLILHL